MTGTPDNSSWLSLVADQEVEAPPLSTLEEIVEFRAHPSRDLSRHNIDLPEDVDVREDVVLGRAGGLDVTAEIYTPTSGGGPFPRRSTCTVAAGAWARPSTCASSG